MKHIACSKMWTDVNLHLPLKQIRNCCKRRPAALNENINFNSHHQIKEDKKYVIHYNELPKNCNHCIETWPDSIYNTWNEWKNNDWSIDQLNNLIDTDLTSRIEIMLSTTCNQTCMYCTENFSSSWANLKNIPIIEDNTYKQNILTNLYSYLRNKDSLDNMVYSFLGGEPLLDTQLFDVIEQLEHINGDRPHAFLITSNLNVKPKLIEKYLSIIEKSNAQWYINCSLDTIDIQGEIIRDGLDFKLFESNLKTLFNSNMLSSIRLLPSVNCLSIPTMYNMYRWFFELANNYNYTFGVEYGITINYVMKPDAMSVGLTPIHYCSEILKCIELLQNIQQSDKKYTENHITHLTNMINLLGTSRTKEAIEMAKVWYIKQGAYKHKNYFNIFPFLNEFLTV